MQESCSVGTATVRHPQIAYCGSMTADSDLDAGIAAAGLGGASSASAVIHAARELFDQAPFREVTVGQVARSAGVNEVTVYRIFGSKDGLAAACWLGNIEKLRRGIERDRKVTSDPLERIRRHLNRLARVAQQDRAITDALIQAVEAQTIERGSKIGALDPRAIVPLPQMLEPLVAEAQKAGLLVGDYASFELAVFLSNSLVLRIMTRREAPAAESAAFVCDIVLNGIQIDS